MKKPYRRFGGIAVFAVLATAGMAACGGSKSPPVASLGNNSGTLPGSTTTLPKGNPTELLDEWASCERAHGIPDMTDPTVTTSGAIHIILPADANSNTSQSWDPQSGTCGPYMTAASKDLGGGQADQKPDEAKLLKYSQCMQSHGFPDFPDPTSHGLALQTSPGSTMTPSNPTFVNTSKSCAHSAGVPGFGDPNSAPKGSIEVQGTSGGPKGGPGGNGGSGAVTQNGGASTGANGG